MANNQAFLLAKDIRFVKYIHCTLLAVLLLFGLSSAVMGLELLESQKNAKPEELFQQANNFYQKGDYRNAAALYQQLADGGYESGNLYYNLGNAYFKMRQKGLAVLNYQKAKRLIPGDADLKANLSYVRDKIGQSGRGTWTYELNNFLAYLATIDQLTVISSILFFILCGVIIFVVLFPQKVRNGGGRWQPVWLYGLFSISFLFLITLSITVLTARELSKTQAVAVVQTSQVRFEPNSAATLYYELKEGAVVNIIEEKNGWILIKRPDGKRGWVEQKNLTRI
jgi:tetratricopeptide (TPR) repeat protein